MTITINIKDINHNTDASTVEAYRRALEIREFSIRRNGNSAYDGQESFTWVTPLSEGHLEVEKVDIDRDAGVVSYSQSEVFRIS